MKHIVAVVAFVALAAPASAQFGALTKGVKRAQQLQDLQITDKEEQQIGAEVSGKIRERFGVVQDAAIHKYVGSVGLLLAQESTRPKLEWRFIVLDTDGVNAFAAPGGFVHITRGALALIQNEAELAGVLGHEMTHVTEKHTINAIKKSKGVNIAADEAGGGAKGAVLSAVAGRAYEMVIENSFDRGDERESDEKGQALAAKVGYAPGALADFLARLAERNQNQKESNGLFASHPAIKERIEEIGKDAKVFKSSALVEARYRARVKYEAKAITDVPQAMEGSAGLAGGSPAKAPEKKEEAKTEEAPKKRGFGLGSLKRAVAPESQTAQVSASGGARGVGPDRNAKGGPNPALVTASISAAELSDFKKGIA
ncbi:MAG TPA: M48 family metalloprotease [Vicinamibacterales bacterium]|nr:M48 family metalloprotease [Vicinamibacterales bacterium]